VLGRLGIARRTTKVRVARAGVNAAESQVRRVQDGKYLGIYKSVATV